MAETTEPTKSKESKKRVLVVDDNRFYSQIIEAELVNSGYQVFIAQDGQEALEIAKKSKPDLILLDLILPVLDGFETLEEFKKDDSLKDMKIVIFSNLAQEEDVKKAEELGADAYMVKKDFSLKELVNKVIELIG